MTTDSRGRMRRAATQKAAIGIAVVQALTLAACVSAERMATGIEAARDAVAVAADAAEIRERAAAEGADEPDPFVPAGPPKDPPPEYRYVRPYPVIDVMSDYWDCRGRRYHLGYDLLGVGEDAGLGSPVYSIGAARITHAGRPDDDPRSYGRRLRRRGTTVRGGRRYPTYDDIPGYGRVYFFTRRAGSWRSGAVLSAELIEGPLAGYEVRYMHLGAVRPELRVGDLLKPGTEIGVMGGTAIQESTPHLHIDLSDPDGNRVDLAPILGVEATPKEAIPPCGRRRRRG